MKFKLWFEDFEHGTIKNVSPIEKEADNFFKKRTENESIQFNDILLALGLPKTRLKPIILNKGTTAIIYKNPFNPAQVIKLTSDINDAKNFNKLLKANFQSPNLVHCYTVKKVTPNSFAILVDYVQGSPMVYSNDAFLRLIQGDNFEDYNEALINLKRMRLGKTRMHVLKSYNKDFVEETKKLIPLFETLNLMDRKGIDLFDFDQNIIDAGSHYVIVDLGQ